MACQIGPGDIRCARSRRTGWVKAFSSPSFEEREAGRLFNHEFAFRMVPLKRQPASFISVHLMLHDVRNDLGFEDGANATDECEVVQACGIPAASPLGRCRRNAAWVSSLDACADSYAWPAGGTRESWIR